MKCLPASLLILAFTTAALPAYAAAAAVADVAGPGASPVAPACRFETPTDTWKIPVNAPGVPFSILENSGAKLTPEITIEPSAEYTVTTDAGSQAPLTSRILKIAGAKAGDTYKVTLGGTCVGGPNPSPTVFTVEYVAEAPTPLTVGTFAEAPQGLTKLTFDAGFLPHLQVASILILADESPLGNYGPGGMFPGPGDNYGVRACVGGACNTGDAHVRPMDLSAATVCKAGRASGVVKVALKTRTRLIGATDPLPEVQGEIHVDCSKATDSELGIGPSTPVASKATGCSVGTLATSTTGSLSAASVCALALGLAFARRRKATRI